jgi:hypothetical protein
MAKLFPLLFNQVTDHPSFLSLHFPALSFASSLPLLEGRAGTVWGPSKQWVFLSPLPKQMYCPSLNPTCFFIFFRLTVVKTYSKIEINSEDKLTRLFFGARIIGVGNNTVQNAVLKAD